MLEVRKMKIAVVCGGLSNERDVSITSGTCVARALRERGHKVVLVDLYYGYSGSYDDPAELFEREQEDVKYSVKEETPDIARILAEGDGSRIGKNVIEICKAADISFLALHGEDGENGKVQATFDMHGIKYTGSGYLGSAIAMDKDLTKRVVAPLGVKTPAWMLVESDGMDIDAVCAQAKLPCVVKPDDSGSSIGVSIANDEAELRAALKAAANEGSRILIEQYICGREVQIGILGDKALPSIEIIPAEGFYDYRNKYQPGAAREITPAEIPAETEQRLADAALTVFHALNLSAYSRADFILDAEGELWFLEINTLPGMTPTSLVPQEAAAVGISYSELCEQIIADALHK